MPKYGFKLFIIRKIIAHIVVKVMTCFFIYITCGYEIKVKIKVLYYFSYSKIGHIFSHFKLVLKKANNATGSFYVQGEHQHCICSFISYAINFDSIYKWNYGRFTWHYRNQQEGILISGTRFCNACSLGFTMVMFRFVSWLIIIGYRIG